MFWCSLTSILPRISLNTQVLLNVTPSYWASSSQHSEVAHYHTTENSDLLQHFFCGALKSHKVQLSFFLPESQYMTVKS
jgi:hypothetical protein